MNGKRILSIAGMTLMLAAGNAVAEDDDGLLSDVTMRLMDLQDKAPDAVINPIKLPGSVEDDSEAVAASADGLETANTARDRRVAGLETALDSVHDAQEAASEAAENSARDDAIPDDLPVPEVPGGRP